MFENLHAENVVMFAIRCYDEPNCIMLEFREDYSRFQLVRKMFSRYQNGNEINEKNVRLTLNNIRVLYNVFGLAATRLLFYHVRPNQYEMLKPFLVLLSYLPDVVYGIKGTDIHTPEIGLNDEIVTCLRNLLKN